MRRYNCARCAPGPRRTVAVAGEHTPLTFYSCAAALRRNIMQAGATARLTFSRSAVATLCHHSYRRLSVPRRTEPRRTERVNPVRQPARACPSPPRRCTAALEPRPRHSPCILSPLCHVVSSHYQARRSNSPLPRCDVRTRQPALPTMQLTSPTCAPPHLSHAGPFTSQRLTYVTTD